MRKWLLVLIAASGLAISSAQSDLTISGTVFARSGSSLAQVFVIACQIVNDTCDDAGSQVIQPNAAGLNLKYQLTGLAAKDYLMLAWRDLNGNQDVDSGDELGVYQANGKPSLVRPPAQGIDLRLSSFNGDFDALLSQAKQAEQSVAAPQPNPAQPNPVTPTSSGLTFSGTVKALSGSSLGNTIVVANVFENGKQNQARSKGARVDASGRFIVTGLEKRAYVLIAWRDLDGNGDVSSADEVAPFKLNGKLALATPPQTNITLQLERGDSSLDALIALTVRQTTPPVAAPPVTPPASPAVGATNLQCLTNYYWQCKAPALDSSDCPLTKFPAPKPETGAYKGYVYGYCGRPMANYKVVLYSTVSKGQVKTTFTDAKGYYRFDVRNVLGSYVNISIDGVFMGKTYSYYLDPIDEVIGADGAIQNFNFDTRKSELRVITYGFDRYPAISDKYTLELRLEPMTLLDGSKGKPQLLSIPMTKDKTELRIIGLKLGAYKMTFEIVTTSGNRYWTYLVLFGMMNAPLAKTQSVTLITPDEVTVDLRLE